MKNTKIRTVMIILLGIVFCALSTGLIALAVTLPPQMAAKFGPAAPELYWWENLLYSVQLLVYEQDLTTPNTYQEPTALKIDLGEPVPSIAGKLSDLHLITNRQAFMTYLSYSGLDRTIQAGEYMIDPGWNSLDIARKIQDATPAEIKFVILPGWRIEEIAQSIPTSGLQIDPNTFLSAVNHPTDELASLLRTWPSDVSLEGIFLPGEYTFKREISLDALIRFFITQFEQTVTAELEDDFVRQGLSLHEAVVLASIVEKESVVDSEKPMIASVFHNRIQVGMKLESDPTAQYAAGYMDQQKSWWKNPLTMDDLSIDSPYNTYQYAGLPPGPICNPTLSALRAVAFPAQTTYLYFRATCDDSGLHNFANTYDEHLNNGCE